MSNLKWFIVYALVGYAAVLALLYVTQRAMQYFPERFRTAPAAAGLPQAEEVVLDTTDGERLIVWHVPPRGNKPVALYFHGNGGSLRNRVDRFRALIEDGSGLVALSYRGYGGSTGTPTEAGLIADALAAQMPVGYLILQSPFTSAADVGAQRYWFVPVRLLMKDQFRSDLRIGKVTAPVLILHGDRDDIVPIALAERLYGLINAPKRFVRIAGVGHNDVGAQAVEAARQFIGER